MKSLLGNIRRPDIIFRANGHFDLTARVVRTLNLSPGDAIDILADNGEYFLYVSRRAADNPCSRLHATLYSTNRKGGGLHLRGSSVLLCRSLLNAIGTTAQRITFIVGQPVQRDNKTYLPIITRSPLSIS